MTIETQKQVKRYRNLINKWRLQVIRLERWGTPNEVSHARDKVLEYQRRLAKLEAQE